MLKHVLLSTHYHRLSILGYRGSQPTINMFQRVMMIESKYGQGTAFSNRHRGARILGHCKTCSPVPRAGRSTVTEKYLELKFLNPGGTGEWMAIKFTILQPSAGD